MPRTALSLSKDPADLAQREEDRQQMRTALLQYQQAVQNQIRSMSDQEQRRLNELGFEECLLLQQRARNPDSFLTAMLLNMQQTLLLLFRKDPAYLEECRNGHQRCTELMARPASTQASRPLFKMQEHLLSFRIHRALLLASSILTERGAPYPGLRAQIAALELQELLRPGEGLAEQLVTLREQLQAEQTLTVEQRWQGYLDAQYQRLPGEHADGLLLAAHPDGALLMMQADGECFEIDLTLLTDDATRFPNPKQPATVLPHSSGNPIYVYIDRAGRECRVGYLKNINRYAFI
jgi:hypothetical protein